VACANQWEFTNAPFFVYILLYQSTALSSNAVDGHQMYFRGSAVFTASTIGIEISPTLPLIFTGAQTVRNLALFSTSHNSEPLSFENAAI